MLNTRLKSYFRGNTLPNSMTGLLIVLISTLPAVLVFNSELQGETVVNLMIFGCQATIFLVLWAWLERTRLQ